jgi:hypothetical protein
MMLMTDFCVANLVSWRRLVRQMRCDLPDTTLRVARWQMTYGFENWGVWLEIAERGNYITN